MTTYKKDFCDFFKKIEFILPLLITAVASFGFGIMHTSLSIDDTPCFGRYLLPEYSLQQGRFGMFLFDKIFDTITYRPFFMDFITVVFLVFAAILWCCFLKKLSNNKLHPLCYTFFSCIFVSYPLIIELFNFFGANFFTAFGQFLMVLALIFTYEGIKNKKISLFVCTSICSFMVATLYESPIMSYVLGIFIVFIMEFFFDDTKSKKFKRFFIDTFKYIIPLGVGIASEAIVTQIVYLFIPHNPFREMAGNRLVWGSESFLNTIKNLFASLIRDYCIPALYYLPITILAIAVVVWFVMMIVTAIKRKNIVISILFFGAGISIFSLSIIAGKIQAYRMCQVFAVFIAFIFMLLWHFTCSLKKSTVTNILKGFVAFLLFVVIVRQANDLNKWFCVEDMRSTEETTKVNQIAYEIDSKFDASKKPVVFIGYPDLSENIRQYICVDKNSVGGQLTVNIYNLLGWEVPGYFQFTQSSICCFLFWGNVAFGEVNTETLNYFNANGHSYMQATPEMKSAAEEYAKKESKPNWPKEGSVFEMDDCIVVNF